MDRSVFEKFMFKHVQRITFSGHRVNDEYTINKRRSIVSVSLSAFDEAEAFDAETPTESQRSDNSSGSVSGV